MRAAVLVFYLVVLLLALATKGEGNNGNFSDDCIAEKEIEERTLKNRLDFMISCTDEDCSSLEVMVTQENNKKCTFTMKVQEHTWVKGEILLDGTISMNISNTSEAHPTFQAKGDCNSSATNSIKTINIKPKGFAVLHCIDGPVLFEIYPNMSDDKIVIPWYNESVNIKLRPLVTTEVFVNIGGEHKLSDCEQCSHISKETTVQIRKGFKNYSVEVGESTYNHSTEDDVKEVVLKKKVLHGQVLIEQFIRNPADHDTATGVQSTTTPTTSIPEGDERITTNDATLSTTKSSGFPGKECPTWIYYAAVAGIAGLSGMMLGWFLNFAVQRCRGPRTKRTADDQTTAPAESGVVSTINDLYEPLEEYRKKDRENNTTTDPQPSKNDEGYTEIINDTYESVDDILARSRQQR